MGIEQQDSKAPLGRTAFHFSNRWSAASGIRVIQGQLEARPSESYGAGTQSQKLAPLSTAPAGALYGRGNGHGGDDCTHVHLPLVHPLMIMKMVMAMVTAEMMMMKV